jgi:type II secretory pathway component PulC
MTVDFNRLKHFSMTYVFMDDDCMDTGGRAMQEQLPTKEIACEYEQTEQNPVVAPGGNSVSFTLRNIDQSEDKDLYSVVLVKEGDDEFYIKSDYFEDADEPYPLDVEISDDDVKFTLEGEDEDMYLYGFFE